MPIHSHARSINTGRFRAKAISDSRRPGCSPRPRSPIPASRATSVQRPLREPQLAEPPKAAETRPRASPSRTGSPDGGTEGPARTGCSRRRRAKSQPHRPIPSLVRRADRHRSRVGEQRAAIHGDTILARPASVLGDPDAQRNVTRRRRQHFRFGVQRNLRPRPHTQRQRSPVHRRGRFALR